LLAQEFRSLSLDPAIPADLIEKLLYESGAKSMDEIYVDIGVGKRMAALVARRVLGIIDDQSKKKSKNKDASVEEPPKKSEPVIIFGSEGVNVQLSPCCLPIPGDAIIGQLNLSRGLVVHTTECSQAKRLIAKEPDKWINVVWGEELNRRFDCHLKLLVQDEKGILARIAAEVSESDVNISTVGMETQDKFTVLRLIVQVEDRAHLARLMRRVRHVPGVTKVSRERE